MLKAMCYGSDEARQRFPRLLQIVELYPDTLDAFIKKVRYFHNAFEESDPLSQSTIFEAPKKFSGNYREVKFVCIAR